MCRSRSIKSYGLKNSELDWFKSYLSRIPQGSILGGTGPRLALPTSVSVAIDGKELNRASKYKYLGVVLDASLTWNAHVCYLIGKVRKRLAIVGRIRKNINMYTAGTV